MMVFEGVVQKLFLLWVFLLPWQTRWIFFAAELNGGFWEYGSMSLYAFDIVWLVWFVGFILWLVKKNKHKNRVVVLKGIGVSQQVLVCSLLLLLTTGISVLTGIGLTLNFYWWLRILQAICVVLFLTMFPVSYLRVKQVFFFAAVIQAFLGISQFFAQEVAASTLLGIAKHSAFTRGDSVVVFEGARLLRAYGSLPHPNVFGGFLFVGLFLGIVNDEGFFTQALKLKERFFKNVGASWNRLFLWFHTFVYYGGLIALTFGIFFSFSRSAWLAFTFAFCGLFAYQNNIELRKRIILVVLTFLFAAIVWHQPFLSRIWSEERLEQVSDTERLASYRVAENLLADFWLIGTGPGASTHAHFMFLEPHLQVWNYQPAHNIFLVSWLEWGIVSFLLFLILITSTARLAWQRKNPLVFLFVGLLIVGLFDHYLLTLPSGLLLFFFVIGLSGESLHSS